MLWHIFRFEVLFRLRRMSTYVYFLIWFFMMFFSVSVRQFGPGSIGGKVLVNSPYILATAMSTLTIFGIVVIAAIFGTAIYRDFEQDTYQLFFTRPITKLDYLGGRFLGSFVVCALIFSGLVLGAMAGTFMPWADQARLMPIDLWAHLQPYLMFTLVATFFLGAIFFMVGAVTRSIVAVNLQGVVFFALYLIVIVLTTTHPETLNYAWPAVVDPLGLTAMDKITRYWTVIEKNTQTIPMAGVMLWNRLVWLGVGMFVLVAGFRLFPFSAEALTNRRGWGWRRRKGTPGPIEVAVVAGPPPAPAAPVFTAATLGTQWRSLTRLRVASIIKEVPFWAIVLIGILFVGVDGWYVGELLQAPVQPRTYLMARMITDEFGLFLIIVTTLYGGELVWKERTIRHDQIHDALPMPDWLNFASQFTALAAVQFALLIVLLLSGVALQALRGYYHFELDVYAKELFLIAWPSYLEYAVVVLLLQTLLPNKFLGHAVVIGYFILGVVMFRFGFEDELYSFADTPNAVYSDMNGYGHFVQMLATFTNYWLMLSVIFAVLAIVFVRRGTDAGWRARLRLAGRRWRGPIRLVTAVGVAGFVGLGVWIHHNTHGLNPFESSKDARKRQAAYEKKYKQFESLPQPKISAVEMKVDIDPARRSFTSTGTFTLVNRTSAPIRQIHLFDANRTALKSAAFDRPFKPQSADKELGYYIYALDSPLEPGGSLHMTFDVGHESKGFAHEEPAEFAYNGTFFDRSYFPFIGYQRDAELGDEDERRDQGLGPVPDLPLPTDPGVRMRNIFTSDADWITFKATVSTSPDQIAIAPGYLEREWTENGRRYFTYDMGDVKIANFYAFVSGRYEVRRDTWRDVALEVYYDPQHPDNVDRMLQSAKAGLEYFTANFGPYQFRQFRILEFPRYRNFAQSFPNTVPYSEGIGFIAHATKEDDPDVPFYVTAHELAHQWWGHQVQGCFAQGSNMLSETLAQYSALMVMEHEVGTDNIRKYLKGELDRYLTRRSSERRKEMPLAFVQNESYVWYQKGSLVMYALKDLMGEARLNAALHDYVQRVKFQEPPYTTSLDFVEAVRAAAPDDIKPLIADMFEHITLYDNRAVEATWKPTADGKYAVTIKVISRKIRADGLGAETPLPINDPIDIGVFAGTGTNQKPLFLEKRRLTAEETTIDVVVDQEPTRAGIDPYNKLIDRQSADNMVAVSKAKTP